MQIKYNVLIAEDSAGELQLLKLALHDSGLDGWIETFFAKDGVEAIAHLDGKKSFDLILLDLNMPRIPGKGVLEYLETDFPIQKPLVIVMSNSLYQADIRESYKLGADGYFQKPEDYSDLVAFCELIKKSLHDSGAIRLEYIVGHKCYISNI